MPAAALLAWFQEHRREKPDDHTGLAVAAWDAPLELAKALG